MEDDVKHSLHCLAAHDCPLAITTAHTHACLNVPPSEAMRAQLTSAGGNETGSAGRRSAGSEASAGRRCSRKATSASIRSSVRSADEEADAEAEDEAEDEEADEAAGAADRM